MSFVEVNGAKLHVEVEGNGPVLILVPGANGTGEIFKGITAYLQDRYELVCFDRRGYGTTEMTTPLPESAADFSSHYRLTTDAEDVIALANHFSPDQPVFVMGSSSGSIVAAEAFATAPDRIARIVLHESPITTVIDTARQQRLNKDAVETALNGDFGGARDKFAAAMQIQPLDGKMMGFAADSTKPDKKRMQGMLYWFKYEVLQYTSQTIDWDVFKANRDKVRLLIGTDSVGSVPPENTKAIGKMLNVPVTVIPGGHLGYAQKPEGFAETLAATLDMR
ncbi:alpha/beta hydrolase [Lacticaseibacillus pabuli]|uniref:Alpha/beta hydrolase n=1 Tax=Lacticaseibacillus pabuli TaxID=3025672 RepID=A0ABY7X0N3_9LACO|nr:alpha/beta hydrolase [Lacticaseibacillus sp. KACC 23028]WDF83725.1 alpha/beta hydrolase [Lacticaseibacillus sp. KACC 23028]